MTTEQAAQLLDVLAQGVPVMTMFTHDVLPAALVLLVAWLGWSMGRAAGGA